MLPSLCAHGCNSRNNPPTTRVSQSVPESPQRRLVHGVGVGMLRGGGDSLSWKLQSFKVSWYLSFLVSTFLGVLVSWLQSFQKSILYLRTNITKHPFHVFWNILIPCSRFSSIGSRLFMISDKRLFEFVPHLRFPNIWDFLKWSYRKTIRFFLHV